MAVRHSDFADSNFQKAVRSEPEKLFRLSPRVRVCLRNFESFQGQPQLEIFTSKAVGCGAVSTNGNNVGQRDF